MTGSLRVRPPSASTYSGEVDAIAATWAVFSALLVLGVFGMIAVFTIKFSGRAVAVRKLAHRLRDRMEWGWITALTVIALGICAWAARVFFEMHIPPPDATPVYVVGKQWMWKIQHADGIREIDELHVPVGEPIKLVMSSQDVIHSFYVPAFRIKQDVVPGRYTYLWFQATRPGAFRLFCAEYCGTSHATMSGKVFAMEKADYEAWRSAQVSARPNEPGTSLASRGRELFTRHGCISCHERGSAVPAPLLDGLYMTRQGMRTGESVLADENYLRESILNPSARITLGYADVMPSFQGQLNEEDLLALIAYIKSLSKYDRGAR